MTLPSLQQIRSLVTGLMLPFHQIERDNDLPVGTPRPENDVEHSWSVAMLACSLAPQVDAELDVGKIAQLALVHDLVEVYAGDVSIFAAPEHLATKSQREELAFSKIKHEYAAFPWIAATIAEYESRSTPEAKFVSAIDKLMALWYDRLDECAYLRDRNVTSQFYFDRLLNKPLAKTHLHPQIGTYYDELVEQLKQHPEYFSQ